jgi:predicted enzyme involved in methoxymalonyl-ACP biosynthesis
MKHVVIALLLGISGVLIWTYEYHPEEWVSWKLQIEREVAALTDTNRAEVEERWFSFQRNLLLSQYSDAEEHYEQSKADLENEFGAIKDQLELGGADESTIDAALTKFREKVEEKKLLFEQRKAEIESQIADIKRQYEETRAALEALNNSVNKVREGVSEGVGAIEGLRSSVLESE